MSEQAQSNVQAFGAGLIGFVAVMAIGGGALMVHHSQQEKAAAKPVAAGAPIDLGSSAPRPSLAPAARAERRAQSPAPLLGEMEEEDEAPAAPASAAEESYGSAASSPESAPKARSSSRLEATDHLAAGEGGSTASAVVGNTLEPGKKAAPSGKRAAGKKAPLSVDAAAGAAVASVHYGATSRSELMGRAAGPVYNIKGGARQPSGVTGKLAGDMTDRIADIRRQLEASGLPAEQRAQLEKDLDEATKALPAPAAAQ